MIDIHTIALFSANTCQKAGDAERKYATIPVTVRAAAICI
jgi:hypothetical protein